MVSLLDTVKVRQAYCEYFKIKKDSLLSPIRVISHKICLNCFKDNLMDLLFLEHTFNVIP